GRDLVPHDPLETGGVFAISEIAHVLFSRKADHDLEAMVSGRIEQGSWWHCVRNADGVDPALDHDREVPVDHFEVVVLPTGRVGLECTVRHALDIQLLVTDSEEFAVGS